MEGHGTSIAYRRDDRRKRGEEKTERERERERSEKREALGLSTTSLLARFVFQRTGTNRGASWGVSEKRGEADDDDDGGGGGDYEKKELKERRGVEGDGTK
ncbi:hypothetical protein PoB_004997900 [Plakobranchus ocellatus]|uniref:Uncharacterized protein n=1 Tax=Plakobranchus ocellatus TaxID=259542 RepID=A0AAV4BYK5_9GAST|nr:hypothetical protein PoB_004997900 [Plakobranchus ocellatus]